MAITTMSSRQFNQETSRAKRAAGQGPVFITDRGRPSHVLVTIDEYRRLTDTGMSFAEKIAIKGGDFDFDPPRLEGFSLRIPDLD